MLTPAFERFSNHCPISVMARGIVGAHTGSGHFGRMVRQNGKIAIYGYAAVFVHIPAHERRRQRKPPVGKRRAQGRERPNRGLGAIGVQQAQRHRIAYFRRTGQIRRR